MKTLVVGCGEVGSALAEVLGAVYETAVYDAKSGDSMPTCKFDIIHICIPWSAQFIKTAMYYRPLCEFLVVHSSVPVGTTIQIPFAFHSPVRGKHPFMVDGLKKYVKYVSCDGNTAEAQKVADYFEEAGMKARVVYGTKTTELAKLLELCRYGTYIAFAKEQEKICRQFGVSYEEAVTEYERTRNEGIDPDLRQPVLYPFKDFVGGHCTVEDMELLLGQVDDAPLLEQAYKIDRATVIWPNGNIYPTAKIGKGCSIGQFCEIGNNVVIGNGVRVGAYTFIPEGVRIEDDVFIAPRVSFSNDKHPPSGKGRWGNILVKPGAVIGMGAIILPGVVVGEKAVVGAGAVVTKDVPAGEVWYGGAAYPRGKREEVYSA
jgi:UDP-2-acetamido-3-amino-2,3-dideoxy-glucuronate N-acetyltransferase